MKRSRSSSLGNIRVLKSPPPTAFWLSMEYTRQRYRNLLPRASQGPGNDKCGDSGGFGAKIGCLARELLLDNCFLCKKGLRQNDIRFMYGDFRAFCSIECRYKQINEDAEKEKASKEIN